MNECMVDEKSAPFQNIRIWHTEILEDPFDDPEGLEPLIPPNSPEIIKDEGFKKIEDDGMSCARCHTQALRCGIGCRLFQVQPPPLPVWSLVTLPALDLLLATMAVAMLWLLLPTAGKIASEHRKRVAGCPKYFHVPEIFPLPHWRETPPRN